MVGFLKVPISTRGSAKGRKNIVCVVRDLRLTKHILGRASAATGYGIEFLVNDSSFVVFHFLFVRGAVR